MPVTMGNMDTGHSAWRSVLASAAVGAAMLAAVTACTPAVEDSPSSQPSVDGTVSAGDAEQSAEEQLAAAVGDNDAARVTELIEAGVDPNANLSPVGTTYAIDIAVSRRSLDVIPVLVEHGAELNGVGGGSVDTPVARAAQAGDGELAAALIAAGADPSVLPTDTSWGPTHYAGYDGNVEVLTALVEAGADPDIRDNHGYTALHFAAATGSLPAMEYLVAAGADLTVVADDGFTPADSAADRNQVAALEYLESLGHTPTGAAS